MRNLALSFVIIVFPSPRWIPLLNRGRSTRLLGSLYVHKIPFITLDVENVLPSCRPLPYSDSPGAM